MAEREERQLGYVVRDLLLGVEVVGVAETSTGRMVLFPDGKQVAESILGTELFLTYRDAYRGYERLLQARLDVLVEETKKVSRLLVGVQQHLSQVEHEG